MAGVGDIKAGSAYVELYTRNNRLSRGLKSASAQLKAFGQTMQMGGRSMMTAAAVFAVPFVLGTKAFSEFQAKMAEVSTMLDKPQKHMAMFTKEIRAMAMEFGESTSTLAKGLYDILSASIAPEKALYVLEASAKAAQAGVTDTGVAADAVTTILNAYGLAAENAGDVTDWLFSVVKRGKTTFGELAPNIGKVATLAATAGVSLEELGAMVATLTRAGLDTETAMTGIAAVLSGMLKPADEAKTLARQLGFEMSTATLKTEGLYGIFQKMGQLSPEDIAVLFPNVRALRGLLPALKNLEGFATDLDVMTNRAGAADAAFAKMSATMRFKLRQAKEAIIDVGVSLGEAIAVPLQDVAASIKRFGMWLADLIKRHQNLVIVVAKATAVLGASGIAFYVIGTAASVAATAIKVAALSVGLLNSAFAALLVNPAILAFAGMTAAVAGLGYAIYKLTSHTAELNDAMEKTLLFGDKQRSLDQAKMERLIKLSQQQRLTTSEQKEATDIIKELEDQYGVLGAKVDKTTGTILHMNYAMGLLNEIMKQNALAEIDKAIAETDRNIKELDEQAESLWKRFQKGGLGYSFGVRTDEELAKLQSLLDRYDELHARRKRILGGVAGAISGSGSPGVKGPGKPGTDQSTLDELIAGAGAENAAKFVESLQNRLHALKIQQIEDEEKRALEAIKYEYDQRREEARKAGVDVNKVYEVAAAEREQIRRDFAKKRQEEEEKDAERRRDLDLAISDDVARLEIENTMKGLDKELALIELARRQELRDAVESGASTDLINKRADLLRQRAMLDMTSAPVASVRGTFNAAALQGLQGAGTGYEARTAAATEAMQKQLADIDRNLKLGQLQYVA